MTATFGVIYAPEPIGHLSDHYTYLAVEASPQFAIGRVGRLMDVCDTLSQYPYRGMPRPDLRPGIRVLAYQRSVMIVYSVLDDRVEILGIYFGGRNYSSDFDDRFPE